MTEHVHMRRPAGDDRTFVVAGGGQAGAWIARTLRAEGFAGRIVVIGEEPRLPYERPPLSKAFLQDKADAKSMALLTEEMAASMNIECWTGVHVTAIDRRRRAATCTGGRTLRYDQLFLTTGARVRTLPCLDGLDPRRTHVLRTQTDAERLRKGLIDNGRLVVIGGGWIGLEVAATARRLGCSVTVLEAAPRLCVRTVPPVVGEYLRSLHQQQGVDVQTGVAVVNVGEDETSVQVTLSSGRVLKADHALIGIGVIPNTELAKECGLVVDDGIIVDSQGRTSDPAIFAAGDVTRHPSLFTGASVRLESWANAQNQAIVAARASLGQDVRYAEAPWFWSDQYTANLQVLGFPNEGTLIESQGEPAAGKGVWSFLKDDGTTAGAVFVNAAREVRSIRKLLSEQQAARQATAG